MSLVSLLNWINTGLIFPELWYPPHSLLFTTAQCRLSNLGISVYCQDITLLECVFYKVPHSQWQHIYIDIFLCFVWLTRAELWAVGLDFLGVIWILWYMMSLSIWQQERRYHQLSLDATLAWNVLHFDVFRKQMWRENTQFNLFCFSNHCYL